MPKRWLYQLGDPFWSRGNTVSKNIRLRELIKRCRVRLLALDEFQHIVDVRLASIVTDVADWLKEQVEEARLAIGSLGSNAVWRCCGRMNNSAAGSVRRYEGAPFGSLSLPYAPLAEAQGVRCKGLNEFPPEHLPDNIPLLYARPGSLEGHFRSLAPSTYPLFMECLMASDSSLYAAPRRRRNSTFK